MTDLGMELREGVAIVSFNRPDRLNAFRRSTYRELRELVERLEGEGTWKALVLTGAGRAFCAGQDLEDVGGAAFDAKTVRDAVDDIQGITRAMTSSRKPSVCAINGPAVGFGVEVTLACDLRFATPEAYFVLPELQHGLFHTNGTYHLLPALVGQGLAADMILTGRRVTAQEALGAGLVSRVVPATELLPIAVTAAAQLSALAPRPLALARRGLRSAELRARLDASLEFEADACMELLAGASHGTGI